MDTFFNHEVQTWTFFFSWKLVIVYCFFQCLYSMNDGNCLYIELVSYGIKLKCGAYWIYTVHLTCNTLRIKQVHIMCRMILVIIIGESSFISGLFGSMVQILGAWLFQFHEMWAQLCHEMLDFREVQRTRERGVDGLRGNIPWWRMLIPRQA